MVIGNKSDMMFSGRRREISYKRIVSDCCVFCDKCSIIVNGRRKILEVIRR